MDWQAVRVQQMVSSPQGGVLLRGFGVPDELPHECGRLLLLIEPIIEQGEADSFSSREQIRLTHREGAVARYLAAGLTNKEIANHLHLSEYTVKDHVKRLMRKTQTTTRTATVSRLLLQYPSLSKAKVTDGIMGTIFAKQAV
ncbi:MAG TPA: helix-turn-helix transcriptional regulator [Nitrospira sp.]|nr:helix-turn-helix transcriptional regulator [Nitrospira sp.]HMW87407.1 helix-turn-helix transcriptional regulator [Nitrospira sp.]HMX91045.1 helix-turn-helix transcriptional regulator [Nitrospira sp.]HMZ97186.1 helix-turn-helix transcriptional regulator [Nitrospira sp.]HNE34597.1 helix-turn-helix transcriptional regulator [Nitrospira sp.]